MWKKESIIGICTYVAVGSGKKSMEVFLSVPLVVGLKHVSVSGLIVGKKNRMWTKEKDKLESISLSHHLQPWWNSDLQEMLVLFATLLHTYMAWDMEELKEGIWCSWRSCIAYYEPTPTRRERLGTMCTVVHSDLPWTCCFISKFQILCKFLLWPILTQSHTGKEFGEIKF